jgi:tubulin-specific chaperone B
MADVPLQVISDNSSSERRITPSWSISQLKAKLEFVTGVPPSSQRLSLKTANRAVVPIEAPDEDNVYLTSFPLSAYAELHVSTLYARDFYSLLSSSLLLFHFLFFFFSP